MKTPKNNGPPALLRFLLKLTRKEVAEKKNDITIDMLQPSRYKPNDLDQMAEETKFSKRKYINVVLSIVK